jgi:hypothetical protein
MNILYIINIKWVISKYDDDDNNKNNSYYKFLWKLFRNLINNLDYKDEETTEILKIH